MDRDRNQIRLAIGLVIVEVGWYGYVEEDFIPFILFPYVSEIFHLKNVGKGSQPSIRSLPSNPPFQLSLKHVSSCLYSALPSLLGNLCLKNCYSFVTTQGNRHLLWEAFSSSHSRKGCSFSVLGVPCGVSAFLLLQILGHYPSPPQVKSKHLQKWDHVSSIFCLSQLCWDL